MAFKARIESRTFNTADCLYMYYLEQHLEGEPQELIRGCLHMDPSEGYKEVSTWCIPYHSVFRT